jgi:MarR family transcriptional regulator, lower aerobic nicotinate degradation pathway regulator
MWEDGPIPGELGVYPGYLLARLGEASRRRFHRALEPEGLHPRHFGVMTIVAAQPGIRQQELHEKTAGGLAERRHHPRDRRVRTIFLTELGQKKLERVSALAGELQRDFFRALTAEERRALHTLLLKLAGASR